MVLESEGKYVEINILQRSDPDSIDFEDVNWLEAEIKINVPGFKGLYGANLRTEDFERFYGELEKIKSNQLRKAEFTTMEDGLHLRGVLDTTGNIKWEGRAKTFSGDSCLNFKMETDNMSINSMLNQIKELLKEYPVVGRM